MTAYRGTVYLAQSGQWSWKITYQNVDVSGEHGYANEDDAIDAMNIEIDAFMRREREEHVRNMLASFRLQGLKPLPADELLHQNYTEGRTTLEDLHNHAIEFALEHAGPDADASKSMLAAGHWITYYDDDLVPDVLLREWPDGKMQIVKADDKGNVIIEKELPIKSELRKRRKAIRNAMANVRLSGFNPSKEAVARMEAYATSNLTWDEFYKG
jgi:uncharacterized protein YegP (UPF0339 family)